MFQFGRRKCGKADARNQTGTVGISNVTATTYFVAQNTQSRHFHVCYGPGDLILLLLRRGGSAECSHHRTRERRQKEPLPHMFGVAGSVSEQSAMKNRWVVSVWWLFFASHWILCTVREFHGYRDDVPPKRSKPQLVMVWSHSQLPMALNVIRLETLSYRHCLSNYYWVKQPLHYI